MAPSKIGIWNVTSTEGVSGKRESVSMPGVGRGDLVPASSKAKGQSPENAGEKVQPSLAGFEGEDLDVAESEEESEETSLEMDEGLEMNGAEIDEGQEEEETESEGDEVVICSDTEESEDESDESDEEDDSEGENEIQVEMPRTIPNSKGEFRVTDWSVIVSFIKKDSTEKTVVTLTDLGCCGLEWQKRVMYLAYFDSEEALQAVLLRPPPNVPLHPKELHVVWLTGILDRWSGPKELHEGIAEACPEGRPLKVRIFGTHLVWVRTPTAAAAKALLARQPLVLKGEPFRVESEEEFRRRCALRVYGISREKRFQKRIEASVKAALAKAKVTGWKAFTYNKDPVLVLKQMDMQLAYPTLSKRAWSDEVQLVRKWDEPAYGLFLSDVPKGTNEKNIRAFLRCVKPERVLCRAKKNFAVVYLSSEEERTKCLELHQSEINGQRVCMRIIDDHIYPVGKTVGDTYVDSDVETAEDGPNKKKKKKTEWAAPKGRGRSLWVLGAMGKQKKPRRRVLIALKD